MSILLLLVCIFLVITRLRTGATVVAPLLVGCVAAVLSVGLVSSFIQVRNGLATVNPADKATILAASISEGINALAFELLLEVPIVVAATVVDRRLRRRKVNAVPAAPP